MARCKKTLITTLQLEGERNHKEETTLTAKINMNYKDFHLGAAAQRVNQEIMKVFGQLVVNDKDQTFWARTNVIEQTVGLGMTHECDSGRVQSSAEVIYYWAKDVKELKDLPVEIHAGMDKKIGDSTEVSAHAHFGNVISAENNIAHKLDKNWTVGLTQRVDMGRKGTKLPLYDVGFRFEYKL